MATIPPLPALQIHAPEQLDPVAAYMRMKQALGAQQLQQGQIQGLNLENQERQQSLADQQAGTRAMQEWDGADMSALPGLMKKHGASAKAVLGAQSSILDYQTKLSSKKKTDLENDAKINDAVLGHLDGVKSLPPEQQPAAFDAAKVDLLQRGYLDPKIAAGLTYQGPEQLDVLEKQFTAHSTAVEDALKQAETRDKNTQAALGQIKLRLSQNSKPGDFDPLIDQAAAGPANRNLNERTKGAVNFYLQRGDLENANKAITAMSSQLGAVEKDVQVATNPQIQQGKIDVATAEGRARANIEAQIARGSNAALAQVPPHLVAPASAAATKAGEDYAQAQSVSQRLQAMMDAARRGNVVSYQLIPQEGALQITTSQGVHRINMAEIQNYGGGSLWQRMQGHLGKQLTGASIPSSVLDDMQEMQKIQASGSQTKYGNTLRTINQTYGSNFKPVQMDELPQNQTQPSSQTHSFSLSAWQRANPKGDSNAAKAAALAQGYKVVP